MLGITPLLERTIDIKNLKLKDLFNKYKLEILPKLKSYYIVCYKLNVLSRSWLGNIKVINLTNCKLDYFCFLALHYFVITGEK